MTVLDYILDGLEAELALERELGFRVVACDRAVLKVEAPTAPSAMSSPKPSPSLSSIPSPSPSPSPTFAATGDVYDFVFLHDRPLSAGGEAMMAKIVKALGKTPETAPIVVTDALPRAQVYVILGGNALKKWFPDQPASPGQWLQPPNVGHVLVTYSPEYILRFGAITPNVQKIKREMWTHLKGLLQRHDAII